MIDTHRSITPYILYSKDHYQAPGYHHKCSSLPSQGHYPVSFPWGESRSDAQTAYHQWEYHWMSICEKYPCMCRSWPPWRGLTAPRLREMDQPPKWDEQKRASTFRKYRPNIFPACQGFRIQTRILTVILQTLVPVGRTTIDAWEDVSTTSYNSKYPYIINTIIDALPVKNIAFQLYVDTIQFGGHLV